MPLSEHEQRLLEQMERALYAEDPKFATSLRSPGDRRGNRRRAAVGVVGALLGASMLVVGVGTSLVVVGVFGFLLMLAGTYLIVTTFGAAPAASSDAPAKAAGSQPARGSAAKAPRQGFMDRVEERWRKRHEGDDGI